MFTEIIIGLCFFSLFAIAVLSLLPVKRPFLRIVVMAAPVLALILQYPLYNFRTDSNIRIDLLIIPFLALLH